MLTVLGNKFAFLSAATHDLPVWISIVFFFTSELTITSLYAALSDNLLTRFKIYYFRTWRIDAKFLCVTVSMYTDHNQPQELSTMRIGSNLGCFEVLCAVVPINCRCYRQIMCSFLTCLKINCPPFSFMPFVCVCMCVCVCVFLRTAIISL
jgi:hypothetical protein